MVSKDAPPKQMQLRLPTSVVTIAHIGQLIRELEDVENHLLQLKARSPGSKVSLPDVGVQMQKVIELNKLNLLHVTDRQTLEALLLTCKQKAPRIWVSFSSEPSPAFLEKFIVWLRQEIHPDVMVNIGLQPAIGAGCIVRTTNKVFDLSLKQTFQAKRHLLLEQIIPDISEAKAA